jgi:methylenetetrahydrofolate--tRNA-(uracil-5-)-methyltransferase
MAGQMSPRKPPAFISVHTWLVGRGGRAKSEVRTPGLGALGVLGGFISFPGMAGNRNGFAYAMGVKSVTVIGAGLAGCEAALQCARRGVAVRLFEMRPGTMTPAHETGDVAELVCSNSLKSDEPENAHGLLKAELRILGSALLDCAERARIPGGKALVVDRRRFSQEVQRALDTAGVGVTRREAGSIPSPLKGEGEGEGEPAITVIATGPLTSQPMAEALRSLLGTENLFFYDAIAPIVSAESLDRSIIFEGSRYGAGDEEKSDVRSEPVASRQSPVAASGYLNCPMSEDEYGRFVDALLAAELHPLHDFEKRAENGDCTAANSMSCSEGLSPIFGPGRSGSCPAPENGKQGTVPRSANVELGAGQSPFSAPTFFEGCLPVEEIARRGKLALAFGPMKPVGLTDPRTGKRPFAVVQLRRENAEGTMYNLVGFQTRLKHGEQERVFRLIPGLEHAKFLRLGSIHRNTFLDSPKVLLPTLQTRARPDLLVAGQLTGVEGYVESIGAGLVAGINAAKLARGEEPVVFPAEMMLGSLLRYITGENGDCTGARPTRASVGLSPFSPENQGQSPAARTQPQSGTVPVFRFQPMNANFGLLPAIRSHKPQAASDKLQAREGPEAGTKNQELGTKNQGLPRLRGRDKRRAMAERALASAREFAALNLRDPA